MEKSAYHGKKRNGFSLVEVLVALFIFLVAILGIFPTLNLSYKTNVSNIIMSEAVKVAQQEINRVKSLPFDNVTDTNLNPPGLSSCDPSNVNASIKRQIRNFTISYGKYFEVKLLSPTIKEVKLTICWNYQGKKHEYVITTVISKGAL